MATVIRVLDNETLQSVKVVSSERNMTPDEEASNFAACSLEYDDSARYSIDIFHGSSVKAIKEMQRID